VAQPSAFTAYFDASGHPSDQPFVVVAGYVANFLQWQGFNKAWEHFHVKAGVSLPFHMTDFMARKREDYKKWAKDDPDADQFLANLCTVPQIYALLNVSCIVDMGIYREIDEIFQLQTMIPAFALGARVCVSAIEAWKKQHSIEYPIECIFEDGDFGRGKFIDLMRVERMPAPIFKDKADCPGLQGADHLAWEIGNYMKKERMHQKQQVGEYFSRLLAIPHIHLTADLAALLDLCERKGIPIKRSKILIP
jgi:hypothetical protein